MPQVFFIATVYLQTAIAIGLTSAGVGGIAMSIAPFLATVIIGATVVGGLYAAQTMLMPKKMDGNEYRPPSSQDVQQTFRQPIPIRRRHYGKVKVGGYVMWQRARENRLAAVIAHGTGQFNAITELWLNDKQVTVDADHLVTDPQYSYLGNELVIIDNYLGTDSQAAPDRLLVEYPEDWSSNHRLRGICYSVLLYNANTLTPEAFGDVYTNGAPQYRIVAETTIVTNPADSSTAYSPNAALCIYDFLTNADGMGRPSSMFDATSFGAAATICEESVSLKAGGATTRYQIHGSYDLTEAPESVLRAMLDACDGEIYLTTSGKYGLRVGKWETPTQTITDAEVQGYSGFQRRSDALAAFNKLKLFYTSPDLDYQEVECDPWEDSDIIISTGIEKVEEMKLRFVSANTPSQARRIGKIAMAKANPEWRGTLKCNFSAMKLVGERFFTLQLAELGINQTFRVMSLRLAPDLTSVSIDCISFASDVYDWTAASEEGATPTVPLLASAAPSTPTGLALTGATTVATSLTASWNLAANVGYQVEYYKLISSGTGLPTVWSDPFITRRGVYVGSNSDQYSAVEGYWRARIRATNYSGPSAWSSYAEGITSINATAPGPPTDTSIVGVETVLGGGSGTVTVTFTRATSSNYFQTEIRANGTLVGAFALGDVESRVFQIPGTLSTGASITLRSFNFLGVGSSTVTHIIETWLPPDPGGGD